MAKPATVSFPTDLEFPELKLPKLDLEALFTTQQANLATVREAQMVLTGAVQAITEVQYGYLDQALNGAKAVFASRELPKAETVKAAGERFVAVAKEVTDLTITAQKRVLELLTSRSQASVTELKAAAA
jgi:hypothetical protein